MPLAWVLSPAAAFPGPTEPGQQWRRQKQRRVGELPATSASAGQAEQQSVVWTGRCVCVGVYACDCPVLDFLFTRLFEKISNICSDHLNILHLDSMIDFATLVFSLFTLYVSVPLSPYHISLCVSLYDHLTLICKYSNTLPLSDLAIFPNKVIFFITTII